jgi:hypothetical protein
VAVSLFVAFASTIWSGTRHFNALYDDVQGVFFVNADASDSIQSDINTRIKLAEEYLAIIDSTSDMDMRNAVKELKEAKNPPDKYWANDKLTEAYEVLHKSVGNTGELDLLYDTLNKYDAILKDNIHITYNTRAAEYNERLNTFAGRLVYYTNPWVKKAEIF